MTRPIKKKSTHSRKVNDIFGNCDVLKVCHSMKQAWHGTADNLLHRQTNLVKLIEDFCNMVPAQESIDFINQLVVSIHPFYEVLTYFQQFHCKHLLPLAKQILHHVDVRNRVISDKIETISLVRFPWKTLTLTRPITGNPRHNRIFMDNDMDFFLDSGEENDYERLVEVFNQFIEYHFANTGIKIPKLRLVENTLIFINRLFVTNVPRHF